MTCAVSAYGVTVCKCQRALVPGWKDCSVNIVMRPAHTEILFIKNLSAMLYRGLDGELGLQTGFATRMMAIVSWNFVIRTLPLS